MTKSTLTQATLTFRSLAPALTVMALVALSSAGASAQQGPASRLGDPRTGAPSPTQPPPPGPVQTAPRYSPEDAEAVPLPPGYQQGGPRAGYADEPGEAGEPGDEDGPSSIEVRNRIRALDATWATLGIVGGPNIGSAILSLVGGGIQIALGAIMLELGSPAADFAPYFFVLGGTSIVRTVLVEFVLRPDPRGVAIEYQNMPDATRAQALARMRFGEEQLRGLAERALITRMVDGGLNIAAGLAVIPSYLVPRDFELNEFEWLFLIGPAFAVVSGIITLASPSAIERRWEAYDAMRRRIAEQRGRGLSELDELPLPPAVGPSFSAGLSADPNGGGMGFLYGSF